MGGGEARARGRRRSARLRTDVSAAVAAAAAAAAQARSAAAAAERAARRARDAARLAEVEDSPRTLRRKCRVLARAIRRAKHLVVMTGAGVSTAAAIPDYRGPRGVWTRLRRGEAAPRVDLARAQPTFTHRALAALHRAGSLRFLVSQNCDALHLRAGTPRRRLAELHGDAFLERCPECHAVYVRTFDTTGRTARHAHGTRRLCHACGRELRDTIVHFGEEGRAAWPLNWAGALRHAAAADVLLCLGSSLRVLRRYPRLFSMQLPPQRRPALYIVNLQWTPKDSAAALKINARCDDVMAELARRLRLRVPRYRASRDPLRAHATPLAPLERHTKRPTAPHTSSSSSSTSSSSRSSSSDSEDERPLTQVAARLHSASHSPPLAAPLAPPRPTADHAHNGSFNLTSFQVNLLNGVATILLKGEHAPSPPPHPPPPSPADIHHKPVSFLRSFRMPKFVKEPPKMKTMPDDEVSEELKPLSVLFGVKREKCERGEAETEGEAEDEDEAARQPSPRPARVKQEPSPDPRDYDAEAARIVQRCITLCRARFYPGLCCMLPPAPLAPPAAPRPPPPRPPQCAWCWRHYREPRCLWYEKRSALGARAWRRVRGVQYLCACCGRGGGGRGAGGGGGRGAGGGGGGQPGWYGKGCRKGVRRRR